MHLTLNMLDFRFSNTFTEKRLPLHRFVGNGSIHRRSYMYDAVGFAFVVVFQPTVWHALPELGLFGANFQSKNQRIL